jgi:hypothetical protein
MQKFATSCLVLPFACIILAGCTGREASPSKTGRAPASLAGDDPATTNAASRFEKELALRWAPVHFQDVDQTGIHADGGKSDYITAINFDGDWNPLNNWENMPNFPLRAAAYYSVVESSTHWFIVYGFYHPRDWSETPGIGEHENDLEGALFIVKKPPATSPRETEPKLDRFGSLCAVVTVFHNDFFSYVPPESAWQGNRENVDGQLRTQNVDGIPHPATAQEARGHGLKAWPQVNIQGDGIRYVPTASHGAVPTGPNDRNVPYELIDIFAPEGLWSRRNDPQTFASSGVLRGDNGDDNAANMPWRWDDHDDGSDLQAGLLAIDPIRLTTVYFKNLGNFSHEYVSNRYRSATSSSTPIARGTAIEDLESRSVLLSPTPKMMPRMKRGPWDDEFDGHGPQVTVSATIRIANGNQIWADVTMKAKETKRDGSEAIGVASYLVHQHGAPILAIESATHSQASYVDTNHDEDIITLGPDELVNEFHCFGDRKGKDIEVYTGVWLRFHPVKIRVRK